MQWLTAIIALEKILSMLSGLKNLIMGLFRKDPVKQISDAEQKHAEGVKNAEKTDDTSSGTFGS